MKDVEYVVIRYVSDPVRNEPLNLGVLVWDQNDCLIRFSSDAIERQLKMAPWLAEDAFDGIETYFEDRLNSTVASLESGIGMEVVEQTLFFPFTPGQKLVGYTAMAQQFAPKPLSEIADELIEEIVHPRDMRPEHRETSRQAVQIANQKLKTFINREKVIKNYPVQIGPVKRRIQFFANSTSNTGLEARSITARMKLYEAQQRADEVTHKALELLEADQVHGMVIFLPYPDINGATPIQMEHAAEHYQAAESIISKSGLLRLIKNEDEIPAAMRLVDPDPISAD